MAVIYHIALRQEWEHALASGSYTPEAADSIICTGAEQYVELANLLFSGHHDLLLLFIDSYHLPVALHNQELQGLPVLRLDGLLPLTAVFEVADFVPDTDGRFMVHHESRALIIHGDAPLEEAQKRALQALRSFERPWWIAGGWAVDCFVGRKTRPHADLEIAILAADQVALYQHLSQWDLRIVAPGAAFLTWDGELLQPPYHQIWARNGDFPAQTYDQFSSDPSMLDFLIEDHAGEQWHYRRNTRVSRHIDQFGMLRNGIPCVRPEIALLFKAPKPRFKDQRDFEQVAPLLDPAARAWLHEALTIAHPASPWRTMLYNSR